ncbi:oxygenase MpaB family protein [Streptomyces violascens]|uniref:oxygenase MpaB family protein n=1 Tax=Streptomyces violascens TaxID=67381 RepID=UPI0037B8B689
MNKGNTNQGRHGVESTSGAHTELSQAEATYRHLAFTELSEDLAFGLNIGFYRTFAIPEIARVLSSTGRMTGQTELRAKTTGLMMYQMFRDGLDSVQGVQTVAALNRIHARWQISNDDFLYVLACFDIAPMRWCDAYAWRRTTAAEKEASHVFYQGLAERMSIREVPPTWGEFAAWMDRYEQRHFTATPEAAELWAATSNILVYRFPAIFSPLIRSAADALLDKPLRKAFSARRPPAAVRALVSGSMRIRAHRIRRAHARPDYVPVLPPSVRELG